MHPPVKRPVVYVFTSDKYALALKGFAHLFNKYWDETMNVIVHGFSTPEFDLPSNFHFISYGPQSEYPVNRWSDVLIKALDETSPDQRPIIMLEDYWLTRPVNVDVVNALWVYMRSTDNVLKIDLMTDRLYAQGMADYGNIGFIDIIRSDPQSQYQMSLMTGIWNPQLLLSLSRPGETPWEMEIAGTPRVGAMGDNAMVLGTRQFPVRHILANRGGDPTKFITDGLFPNISGLSQPDIIELRNLGIPV